MLISDFTVLHIAVNIGDAPLFFVLMGVFLKTGKPGNDVVLKRAFFRLAFRVHTVADRAAVHRYDGMVTILARWRGG